MRSARPAIHSLMKRLRSRRGRRAFTLLELLVVVIIVGLVAVMAIPTMTSAGLDRRVHETASNIQDLIREARARAMGRGGAVMVMLDADAGHFRSYEIRSDVDGGQNLPLTSCRSDWATPASLRQVGHADTDSAFFTANYIKPKIVFSDDTTPTKLYLCFTPQGRTYVSNTASFAPPEDVSLTLPSPLTSAFRVEVKRTSSDGATTYGIVRNVLIPPTGAARIVSGAP